MIKYDFNQTINRKGTDCIKFDWARENGHREDVYSLWVADMDFETIPEIKTAICERAKHGVFGYTLPKEEYWNIVTDWIKKQYGYETKNEWFFCTPGGVFALSAAIRSFTQPGEAVMIQRPVYYPFSGMIEKNGRKLVNSSLMVVEETQGVHYEMDYEDVERKIIENNVKLFLLCNPHNPGGRVWTKEELTKLGNLCIKHHVIIVSDEIHADFTFHEHKHTMFSSISEEFAQNSITCTSPTKTFNIAGLQISNIFTKNPQLREKMISAIIGTGYDEPNIFGVIACKAAYQYGEEWLRQLKEYLSDNIQYIKDFLQKNMPLVKMMEPQGTYLVWLDFSTYGYTQEQLDDIIVNKANVWLDSGTMFGKEGAGYQRINIATSRAYLEQAMTSLHHAFMD